MLSSAALSPGSPAPASQEPLSEAPEDLQQFWSDWVRRNEQELRKYPDCNVAIDPVKGVVVHARDHWEFLQKHMEYLEEHPQADRRLMLLNTSMFSC